MPSPRATRRGSEEWRLPDWLLAHGISRGIELPPEASGGEEAEQDPIAKISEMLESDSDHTRRRAMEEAGGLVDALYESRDSAVVEDRLDKLAPLVIRGIKDGVSSVREQAVEAVSEMSQLLRQRADYDRLIGLVLPTAELIKDSKYNTRTVVSDVYSQSGKAMLEAGQWDQASRLASSYARAVENDPDCVRSGTIMGDVTEWAMGAMEAGRWKDAAALSSIVTAPLRKGSLPDKTSMSPYAAHAATCLAKEYLGRGCYAEAHEMVDILSDAFARQPEKPLRNQEAAQAIVTLTAACIRKGRNKDVEELMPLVLNEIELGDISAYDGSLFKYHTALAEEFVERKQYDMSKELIGAISRSYSRSLDLAPESDSQLRFVGSSDTDRMRLLGLSCFKAGELEQMDALMPIVKGVARSKHSPGRAEAVKACADWASQLHSAGEKGRSRDLVEFVIQNVSGSGDDRVIFPTAVAIRALGDIAELCLEENQHEDFRTAVEFISLGYQHFVGSDPQGAAVATLSRLGGRWLTGDRRERFLEIVSPVVRQDVREALSSVIGSVDLPAKNLARTLASLAIGDEDLCGAVLSELEFVKEEPRAAAVAGEIAWRVYRHKEPLIEAWLDQVGFADLKGDVPDEVIKKTIKEMMGEMTLVQRANILAEAMAHFSKEEAHRILKSSASREVRRRLKRYEVEPDSFRGKKVSVGVEFEVQEEQASPLAVIYAFYNEMEKRDWSPTGEGEDERFEKIRHFFHLLSDYWESHKAYAATLNNLNRGFELLDELKMIRSLKRGTPIEDSCVSLAERVIGGLAGGPEKDSLVELLEGVKQFRGGGKAVKGKLSALLNKVVELETARLEETAPNFQQKTYEFWEATRTVKDVEKEKNLLEQIYRDFAGRVSMMGGHERGGDGVYEHSLHYVNADLTEPYSLCLREIFELAKLGALDLEHIGAGEGRGLHITVGGIRADVGAHLLNAGLILTGWTDVARWRRWRSEIANVEREEEGLTMEYEIKMKSGASKGFVFGKEESELEGALTATEYRSFAPTLEDLPRVIESLGLLGTALRAVQQNNVWKLGDLAGRDDLNECDRALITAWFKFQGKIDNLYEGAGLPNPFASGNWSKDEYGEVGKEVALALTDKEGMVKQAQKAVIEARREIKRALELAREAA